MAKNSLLAEVTFKLERLQKLPFRIFCVSWSKWGSNYLVFITNEAVAE